MRGILIFILCVQLPMISGQNDSLATKRFTLSEKYGQFISTSDSTSKKAFTFCVETQDSILSLTFDDGPLTSSINLTQVLNDLECPATFFVLTCNLNKINAVYYQDPLFTLGIHGDTHKRLIETTHDTIEMEFRNATRKFNSLGLPVCYYRPAFGVFDKRVISQMEKYNLKGILWNIDSYDWNGYTGDMLINRVLDCARPGSIILLHEKTSTDDISHIIISLRDKGYKMVSLDELLTYPLCTPP